MKAKPKRKPAILPVKHVFVEALDNYLNESMLLMGIVGHVLKLKLLQNSEIEKMLQERYDAARRAWSEDEEGQP